MNKSKSNLWVKLEEGGRVVIPSEYRKALELKPGVKLLMSLEEDGTIRITPLKVVTKQIQEWARKYVPEGVLLSEELIQERRAEALNE